MANDICNGRLDTISPARGRIRHRVLRNGISPNRDAASTSVGQSTSAGGMTEKLAKAMVSALSGAGVQRSAVRRSQGADKFAVHVGGQELACMTQAGGIRRFNIEPHATDGRTPGRHTPGLWAQRFRRIS